MRIETLAILQKQPVEGVVAKMKGAGLPDVNPEDAIRQLAKRNGVQLCAVIEASFAK